MPRLPLLEPVPRLFGEIRDHALHLVFPPLCGSCGADIEPQPRHPRWCADCWDRLPRVDVPACPRCAAPAPTADGVALPCPVCRRRPVRFDAALAAGWYEGLLRDLILRMKTDRGGVLAASLADLMATQLGARLRRAGIDLIIPAPMHPWRQWQRGVHPTALLCSALARRFGWQDQPRLLRKQRNTPPQTGLSREGRVRNVRGALTAARRANLCGKTVLVIDDVMTTGATSNEAARVLKRRGAARVVVAVAARTKNG